MLFKALDAFEGATQAFHAQMSRLEQARNQQAQINEKTLCLILDHENSLHDGTLSSLTSVIASGRPECRRGPSLVR